MKTEGAKKTVFLAVIAGRQQKNAILAALAKSGVLLTHVVYGKGSVKGTYLQNILGLVPEENKVFITGLISAQKSDSVFDMLINKFDFDQPNTGIAFIIPIEKLSY